VTTRLIKDYISDLTSVLTTLPFSNIEKTIETVIQANENNKKIFIFGNGGSAATASHFTCDINKGTLNGLKNRFRVICLSDNIPTMLAYANDMSYEDIFIEQLKNYLEENDVVIGISGSGNSQNVLKAIEYAGKNKAVTIAFTGFNGGKLAGMVDIPIVIPVNDMQKVEDGHLILTHMIMQALIEKFEKH
jgi:D-sedoheptulose 7-phosphate isomerase